MSVKFEKWEGRVKTAHCLRPSWDRRRPGGLPNAAQRPNQILAITIARPVRDALKIARHFSAGIMRGGREEVP
jgi:hypothetical protein